MTLRTSSIEHVFGLGSTFAKTACSQSVSESELEQVLVDLAIIAEWHCDRNIAGCLRLRHGLTFRNQIVLVESGSTTDPNFQLHIDLSLMHRGDEILQLRPVTLWQRGLFMFDTFSC